MEFAHDQHKAVYERVRLYLEELFDDSLNGTGSSNKTAQDYRIQDGSELYVEPKSIKVIIVMPNGKTHKVQVEYSSDMSDLIKSLVESEADIASASGGRVFKFGGKELCNGKTVKEMGIQDGSKIKLDLA